MHSLDELNTAMSRDCCVEPEQVPRDRDYARTESGAGHCCTGAPLLRLPATIQWYLTSSIYSLEVHLPGNPS